MQQRPALQRAARIVGFGTAEHLGEELLATAEEVEPVGEQSTDHHADHQHCDDDGAEPIAPDRSV